VCNPCILLKTWEWTFLKVLNLLNKKTASTFFFHLHPSKDAEAEEGRMVKERDFEAEKKSNN
jgi:hypothetical protein